MLIELNTFSILDILSFASAFMLGLLFVCSTSENKKANVFLGLFLLSLSIEVLGVLSEEITPPVKLILQTTLFTIPFLLLYVLQTINFRLKPIHFMLFLPGLLVNLAIYFEDENILFGILEYLFNLTILFSILSILNYHKKRIGSFYSDLENKTLQWIRLIVYIFIGFHALWIAEDIIGIRNESLTEYFVSVSTIATFFMILWIGRNGFSQQEIFKQKLFVTPSKKGKKTINPLDEKIISEGHEKDKETFDRICQTIVNEKLFTDPKLNLRTLSMALELNEKELSRLINQQSNSNFYRFINQFRVDNFKNLLCSGKARQLSILGLAEEAGFNSKSTFYTAFKTLEGITPKQYESKLNKSE